MRPDFSISVGGDDITGLVRDRLVNLSIVDEAGFTSDRLSLTLDNRGLKIAPPPKGRTLDVNLGYEGALHFQGRYVADAVQSRFNGSARTLIIRAKAADMTGALKAERVQSWGLATIGEIVAGIAERHGLTPVVADSLSGVVPATVPYGAIEQLYEPDMDFLSRLADQYDAVAKPVAGRYLFVPSGDARAADGRALTRHSLSESDVSDFTADAPDRDRFGAVEARYVQIPLEQTLSVSAGAGDPVHRMGRVFGDEATAQRAAQDRLKQLQRSTAKLSLTLSGRPDIFAEDALVFDSADPLASGEWVVARAEHRLFGTLTTRLECHPQNVDPS